MGPPSLSLVAVCVERGGYDPKFAVVKPSLYAAAKRRQSAP